MKRNVKSGQRMVDDLIFLGIDTSGKNASAAIFDTESEIFTARKDLYTQKTHSQVIMPLCKDIMEQSGININAIDAIAVANGPGSYTGLRVGVAAVKAMCYALDRKCCGISTLESLAWNNITFQGTICTMMKARKDLVYACMYKSDGYFPKQIIEEKVIGKDELAEILAFNGETALLCGDAAEDFFTEYQSERLIIAPPHTRVQNAAGVCLAAISKRLISPDELNISYLQKVKAERDLEEKKETDKSSRQPEEAY